MSLGLVRMAVLLSSETTIAECARPLPNFEASSACSMAPAEGTGCAAAVGVPQNDDLHVRVLVYVFFAARGRVSCSSCSSKRAGTLKHGVIGDTTTEGRAGRQALDRTLRLVAELHWPVHAVMSGSDPHCFVRVQDQPGAFETSGGDAPFCAT